MFQTIAHCSTIGTFGTIGILGTTKNTQLDKANSSHWHCLIKFVCVYRILIIIIFVLQFEERYTITAYGDTFQYSKARLFMERY